MRRLRIIQAEVFGWKANGTFGYAQNAQTLLITYMNSFYNYSGSVKRRWGKFRFSDGRRRIAHSGLTQQAGTANSSQSYNASMGFSPLITRHRQLLEVKWTGAGYRCGPGSGSGALSRSAIQPGKPLRRRQLFLFAFQFPGQRARRSPPRMSKSISNTSNCGSRVFQSERSIQCPHPVPSPQAELHERIRPARPGIQRVRHAAASQYPSFYIGVSRWFNFF